MNNNSYTVTDLFCGAGGSSTGAVSAGATIRLALNHWKTAIATHNINHPDADHDCTDISNVHPLRYGATDILIASPECTNHTNAKGQAAVKAQLDLFNKGIVDPGAERSRATMWDVPRFAEYHHYKFIVVENVVEATKWVMFPAWLQAMASLGYSHRVLSFNSQFFGDCPQSRDRIYVVFWKTKMKTPDLDFCPDATCDRCGITKAVQVFITGRKVGKYKQQYHYHCHTCGNKVQPRFTPASAIIDWSDVGTRIGNRKKPLAENTMKRIRYGIEKYFNPFLSTFYTPGENFSPEQPLKAITANDHHSLVTPALVGKMEHSKNNAGIGITGNPMATMTTRHSQFLAIPSQIVGFNSNSKSTETYDTIGTIRANGQHHGLLQHPAEIVEFSTGGSAKGIHQPLGAIRTMAYPGLIQFLGYYNGTAQASSLSEPVNTITTIERHYMVSQNPDDWYFRMLKIIELQLGMAFPGEYILTGNGKEKVKQLGNAVTPPPMEWIIGKIIESFNQ